MTADDVEIQLLRSDHAAALLAFELENRAYFARTIPDRGDAFFERFADVLDARLAEQADGDCYFHLAVGEGGAVLGRFNLVDVADGAADLGYRVAERAGGRGLATWAVRQVCCLAANAYGLTELHAATTLTNAASHTVLTRNGFRVTGETTLSAQPARTYTRGLADLVGNAVPTPGSSGGRRPR